MKILLTGAGSFTAKHLIPLLREARHELFFLVRRKLGLEREIPWDFSGPLPDVPPCDVVIHLAAYVYFGSQFQADSYRINTLSTLELCRYAEKCRSFFILASATHVHGSATMINRISPVAPVHHYGISKFLAEEVVKSLAASHAILRIGGIYGLGGPPHLGLNKAISAAYEEQVNPTLKGPGKGRRNYILVEDVARWIDHLVKQYEGNVREGGQTLYLAGPQVMTIEEYLNAIVEILVPQGRLEKAAGPDSSDSVVEGSPAPFSPTFFEDYLRFLKERRCAKI